MQACAQPTVAKKPRRNPFRLTRKVFSYPYILILLLFVVIPTAMILVNAFIFKGQASMENFVVFFTNGIFLEVLGNSILVGAVSTILCLLIGYPVAYILSKSKHGMLWMMLFVIPMWINFLIKTRALASIFDWLGMRMGSFTVVIGMVYIFLPMMIMPLHTTISNIDKSYIEASRDLGADGFTTFIKVILPLSVPGIISGITMVFIPTISSFAITTYLGGGNVQLFGDIIYNACVYDMYGVGSVMSIIMLLFVFIASFAVNRYGDTDKGGALL